MLCISEFIYLACGKGGSGVSKGNIFNCNQPALIVHKIIEELFHCDNRRSDFVVCRGCRSRVLNRNKL